jgi:6-phosphofructokinase 2
MNPAIDVLTSAPRLEPERKLRCTQARRDPGGGGINVARVAARLGARATAVFPSGGFAGAALERLVRDEGVDCRPVPIPCETREDFTVLDEHRKQQYRFVLPGPRLRALDWRACLRTLNCLDPWPDVVCASGSLPPGVPDDFYALVADLVARRGGRLVLDTSGAALSRALERPLHLIKPNLRELRELSGATATEPRRLVHACRDLMRNHPLEAVALTLGAGGALLVTLDQAWRGQGPALEPVSTVGAGDSFLGAMVWAIARKKPLDEAFRYAVAAGSAAVLAAGTALCDPRDVKRLLGQVVIEPVSDATNAIVPATQSKNEVTARHPMRIG